MLQEENAINLICFLLLGFVFSEGQDSLTVRPHSFLPCLPPSFPRAPPAVAEQIDPLLSD